MSNLNIRLIKTQVPSYLKTFWPEESEVTFVHGKNISTSDLAYEDQPTFRSKSHDDSDVGDLELTGDPLRVDLGGNETFTSVKSEEQSQNWSLEELRHYPLSLEDARDVINSHLRIKRDLEEGEQNLPIFAVCDGRDDLHTVFLAARKDRSCIMTAALYILGLGKLNEGPLTLEIMQSDHRMQVRKANVEIKYHVQIKYQLYGTHLQSPAALNRRNRCNGSISLIVTTNKCEFDVPRDNSSVKMRLQVIAGHHSSELYSLWNELCTLHCYLEIMEDKELSQNEATVICTDPVDDTTIFKNIAELMTTKSLKREAKTTFDVNNLRDDSFLDKLWKILKNCENIGVLRDSFHCLFEELASAGSLILVQEDGSYIASLISGILCGKVIISSITFSQALRLLFELGAEKLKNDYVTIIKHVIPTKLQIINSVWDSFRDKKNTIQEARRTRITQNLKSTSTSAEQYTKMLSYLGQLHVTTEFVFLVKQSVNLSKSSFDYFCESVVKSHVENVRKLTNFTVLRSKLLCEFDCKLNSCDVNVIEGRNPVQWTLIMKSVVNGFKVSTIYDLSKNRVFPPVIYDDFDILESPDDEMVYYVSKMVKHNEYI